MRSDGHAQQKQNETKQNKKQACNIQTVSSITLHAPQAVNAIAETFKLRIGCSDSDNIYVP